jgi:hypothetical protein
LISDDPSSALSAPSERSPSATERDSSDSASSKRPVSPSTSKPESPTSASTDPTSATASTSRCSSRWSPPASADSSVRCVMVKANPLALGLRALIQGAEQLAERLRPGTSQQLATDEAREAS